MINVRGNYWKPGDGYLFLTNGEIYADSIYLGSADSADNWHDTNDLPPEVDDISSDEAIDIILGGGVT